MAGLLCLRNFDVLLLLLIVCLALSACEGPRTAWSAESRSPDGRMIATARAEETSGIGTGDPGTSVYLNWTSGSQPPTIILALLPPQRGITKVGMNWLTPTHLELTYSGNVTADFQAIRCHGVEISVRVLSEGTSS
jgi:hypothetical protein